MPLVAGTSDVKMLMQRVSLKQPSMPLIAEGQCVLSVCWQGPLGERKVLE
jgi:hypothetical protein